MRLLSWIAVVLVSGLLCGCQTAQFYAQAIHGQCQILHRQQPCEKLLADPKTDPKLRAKLQLTREICAFAQNELRLPARGHYQHYADLQRPYVVWDVYAAPRFSLEARTWWYPFVGRLAYRGYFKEADAQRCAERLRQQGYDVHVGGVEAYSTLGWLKDPLLNTFIHHDETGLAEILFHELAHQRVFIAGDTDFNEAFATAVEIEAVRRWLRARGDQARLARCEAGLQREAGFVQLVQSTRQQLQLLYGDERRPDGKLKATRQPGDPAALAVEKQRIFDGFRQGHERLKNEWGGRGYHDAWFAEGPNNAHLNSVATYHELLPAFTRLLTARNGDLEDFFNTVQAMARLSKTERRARLQSLGRVCLPEKNR